MVKLSDENLKAQDKVVINIINYLDKVIPETDNKMKEYVKYLEERTELKPNRIKIILTLNKVRRITIKEIYEISTALNVEMKELFRNGDDL